MERKEEDRAARRSSERPSHTRHGGDEALSQRKKDVKELGRKARVRLEEERNKRAEVIRIDPEEAQRLEKSKQPQPGKISKAVPKSSRRSSREDGTRMLLEETSPANKKRRRRQPQQDGGLSTTALTPQNADMWMPVVDHLPTHVTGKETRSNLVRLHGLPEGTTPVQIKKFFSGLQPQLIAVLLSCPATISEWDALDGTTAATATDRKWQNLRQRPPSQPTIKRYSSHFRVVVKFDSAPTAELAADRSGETIDIASPEHEDNNHQSSSNKNKNGTNLSSTSEVIVRAAIGVTQLPKHHAIVILQNLSIDAASASTNNGAKRAIHLTLASVENALLPHVDRILWMDAQRQLHLTFDSLWPDYNNYEEDEDAAAINCCKDYDNLTLSPSNRQNSQERKTNPSDCTKSSSSTSSKDQMLVLTRHRNRLFDAYRKLERAFPYPSTELLDSILGDDAAARLVHQASLVLCKRIRRMDDRLLEMRRRRFFDTLPSLV
ncbi:hypothetical protein ACA910_016526 [Epithemia clementina (nom. ined.)]